MDEKIPHGKLAYFANILEELKGWEHNFLCDISLNSLQIALRAPMIQELYPRIFKNLNHDLVSLSDTLRSREIEHARMRVVCFFLHLIKTDMTRYMTLIFKIELEARSIAYGWVLNQWENIVATNDVRNGGVTSSPPPLPFFWLWVTR